MKALSLLAEARPRIVFRNDWLELAFSFLKIMQINVDFNCRIITMCQ